MKAPRCPRFFLLLFLFAVLLPGRAVVPLFCHAAETGAANDLFPQNIVKVRAWLENGPKAVVTGQVSLIVEVATRTWFTQGTRIRNIEIRDAVIPQANPFATNFTRQDGGRTWSVQQWTLIIHPMKEKTYIVPGIPVTFSSADEKGRPVSGQRFTNPVQFQAFVPGELAGTDHWAATSQMTARQWMDTPLIGRNVGDALKRRVEIEAYDLPAMMLPVFSDTVPEGLALYEDPPKLIDDVNRGIRIGKRVESVTYVIEKPGSYRIPGRVYSWWNVIDRRVETIALPDQIIATSGFEKAPVDTLDGKNKKSLLNRYSALWAFFILCAAAAVFITVRLLLNRRDFPVRVNRRFTEKHLRSALKAAFKHKDAPSFLRTLYAWFDLYGEGGSQIPLRQFLMEKRGVAVLADFDRFMSQLYGKPSLNASPSQDNPMQKLIGITRRRFVFKFGGHQKDCFGIKKAIFKSDR